MHHREPRRRGPRTSLASEVGLGTSTEPAEIAELRQSERLFRNAFESAHVGRLIVAPDGRLTKVNAAFAQMLGYGVEQLQTMNILALTHPDDLAESREALRSLIARECSSYRLEKRYLHKQGHVLWVDVHTFLCRSESGEPLYFITSAQDITERRRTEEELRKNESLIGAAAENLPLIFYVIGRDGRFRLSVGAGLNGLGLAQNQVVGQSVYEIYRDNPVIVEAIRNALEGATVTFESHVGDAHYLNICVPHLDANNTLTGTAALAVDISERYRAERALRESEASYRALVFGLPDVVMRFDREGRHLFVSDNVAHVTELTSVQFLGRTHRELGFPADLCRVWEEALAGVFETGTPFESEFGFRGAIFNWRLVPERNSQGRVASVLSIARDITAQRRAEEQRARLEAQLQQAQKMESVGRLAGGVAHDFNNMLGVILGSIELALHQVSVAHPMHSDLLEVRKAAERSAALTEQLLAFARRQTVEPRILDLNEAIASLLKMLERLIGEDVRLEWKPTTELWQIRIDPAQFNQVLTNLCVNARDAIAGTGTITIAAANQVVDASHRDDQFTVSPGEYLRLTVGDDGCGMSQETLAHIFEPFFTTKDVGEGTGLGLAMVYGVVSQNGGFVDVSSELGQGTTFSIYLPRHAGSVDVLPGENADEPVAHEHATILLVEDEPSMLRVVRRMLEGQGYTVLAAGGPREALRISAEQHGTIQLLVTDVVMPEMNGWELSERLLASNPQMKRLFMSGHAANLVAMQKMLNGGEHFIEKPFRGKELTAKVRQILQDAPKG